MDREWMIAGWAGLIAAGGLIAACWRHVLGLWAQVSGRVVVQMEFDGYGGDALRLYARDHWSSSRFSPSTFNFFLLFVRPRRRHQLVVFEDMADARLYWCGWTPIWATCVSPKGTINERNKVTIHFPRGTFSADKLATSIAEYFNDHHLRTVEESAASTHEPVRHFIEHVYGTCGNPIGFSGMPPSASAETGDGPRGVRIRNEPAGPESYRSMRLLKWSLGEVGAGASGDRTRSLQHLAMPQELEAIRLEVQRWLSSREWYFDRGLPWRRGYLLHGPTGTGKTSLVRALAEAFDLPVFVYDLASHRNSELQRAWSRMLRLTPCVALIEDIDGVFDGRKNVATDDGLTFDCLLNCLDGIDRSDGLLTFITTNRIEHLDAALGAPTESGDSSRPGRVDRLVHLGPLDNAGREKLVRRILADWPAEWESAVSATNGCTGAQVQEFCTRRAQELFWCETAETAAA